MSLIIPDSVTYIDYYAFSECPGLNGSLIIGDLTKLLKIGKKLKSIKINLFTVVKILQVN